MDTQKREFGIGHRIDQVTYQVLALRPDLVVLAAERHDSQIAPDTRHFGDAVAMQPRAVDQEVCFEFICAGVNHPAVRCLAQPVYARASNHASMYKAAEYLTHARVVDDALFGNTDGG